MAFKRKLGHKSILSVAWKINLENFSITRTLDRWTVSAHFFCITFLVLCAVVAKGNNIKMNIIFMMADFYGKIVNNLQYKCRIRKNYPSDILFWVQREIFIVFLDGRFYFKCMKKKPRERIIVFQMYLVYVCVCAFTSI